jgi:hypothetical protein
MLLAAMRGTSTWILSFAAALAIACGGSTPPPEEAEPASDVSPDDVEQTASTATSARSSDEPDRLDETSEQKPSAKSAGPEPVFKEGGSVNEAIQAVPQGADRVNLDQETLGKPLQDVALYEPCKPGAARIKLKVAVWDGRAVGIDLATTPKNPKLEECLKQQIRGISWPDKVRSLNTVEYQL